MVYRGIARGKTIELEEFLPYAEGQPLRVSVEPFADQLQPGSPAAIQQAMHAPPHLTWEDVSALEQAIADARLPVQDSGVFEEEQSR
jgi:hypothetical protein